MTLDEFETWLASAKVDVHVNPYVIVACRCGDPVCKGWRLVPPERVK